MSYYIKINLGGSGHKYLAINSMNLIWAISGLRTSTNACKTSSFWAGFLKLSAGSSTMCQSAPATKFNVFLKTTLTPVITYPKWISKLFSLCEFSAHTFACLPAVCEAQVWGWTHGWLSNSCWCLAKAMPSCSWIIKLKVIVTFTQINRGLLDANCDWVSGYFLQYTWASSKPSVSIIDGSCTTQGPQRTMP